MKSIVWTQYGSPDLLELRDIEKPTPKDHQVLVKIRATSVNPLDWHRMRGEPFLARIGEGYLKPKDSKLGADIAGIVEAVGANVTEFKVGDEVFGSIGAGGFAEYAVASEKNIALKPANVSFEAAAAMPVVTFTAVQGLRDTGKIEAGQKVLVNGASGGIGTVAVQIAKSYGTEVTGVCSGRNMDLVRSIGADHVIDYTKTDFTKTGEKYDLIYCSIGNRSTFDYKRALSPNGKAVIAGFTSFARLLEHVIIGGLISRNAPQYVGIMPIAKVTKADLLYMKEAMETGKIVPVIDSCYPLEKTGEAIRHSETMRARGKIVVSLAPSS